VVFLLGDGDRFKDAPGTRLTFAADGGRTMLAGDQECLRSIDKSLTISPV